MLALEYVHRAHTQMYWTITVTVDATVISIQNEHYSSHTIQQSQQLLSIHFPLVGFL